MKKSVINLTQSREPAGTKEPAGSFCVAGQSGRPDKRERKMERVPCGFHVVPLLQYGCCRNEIFL